MRELGQRVGNGAPRDPSVEPDGSGRFLPDAVVRADLRRSRQAVFGPEVHPQAALFASRLAQAVGDSPLPGGEPVTDPGSLRLVTGSAARADPDREPDDLHQDGPEADWTEFGSPRVLPALRDAVFGDGPAVERTMNVRRVASAGPESVRLPSAPALLCDRADRILRANAALLRLIGAGDEHRGGADIDLTGMRLAQLVHGPDTDSRLVRADGSLARVRVIRWELPDEELSAVVLVDLGEGASSAAGRPADHSWTAELERLARVGTWSFELATSTLHRSETLDELYVSVGIDPHSDAAARVESEQVALLSQGLHAGVRDGSHHAELRLPGDRLLSCRAEVECAADGTPVRLVGVVRDVTTPRIVDGRLQHSGQRFADLMALIPDGVGLIDGSGRVVDANAGLCALLGVTVEGLRGVAAAALAADRQQGSPLGALPGWLRAVAPGTQHGYRIEAAPLVRGDGTVVWCELSIATTSSDDGGWFWLVVCHDISERRRAAELLRSAGTVDELTRLPNRAASLELVDRMLAGPGRDRVAVVCGDLDDFQRVNSSLGHEAGDDLLVTLAGRLQRELPVGCTAARLSGDEFVVICADHAMVGGPDQLARIVADLLRISITVHGRPVQMTASVGLATPVPSGEVRAADLLRFAEVAMRDAKRRESRGGIGMATDGVVNSATRALELEAELRAAIASGGLVLDYQPVVGPDGTVLSAEALVRWPHPERGLIPPGEFLPVAQRSGLLRDLDLWVLRTAATEAATWPSHEGRQPSVAVNLAGLLPGEPDFLDIVADIVADSGLAWERLTLELVETSLVALPPHALAAMAELTARGLRFAVDDFGTGYSSLARLKELPAQIIKVDRAFVTGVGEDPADFAVARAVVDMARAMGRTTVAEGVETADQFHVLRGIGVDAYQGWLFARPLAPGVLREALAGGRLPTPAASPGYREAGL
ncbi:putative bifunctional diguanylate cyclase/phosphodiesterase [Pseudonocardia sp. GCM10023141]|uniref:putative bifunctional diguanylate cyclase/phosphodiesterase n=1 Tax=Pseudonocardia sp. GCM10023141 TaxID=3252653 RepID=UPI003623AB7C